MPERRLSRPAAVRASPGRASAGRAALVLAAAAIAALVAFLIIGEATPAPAAEGLSDAGWLVGWLLPLSRLGMDLAAVGAVGSLLFAAVLAPAGGQARTALRYGVGCALAWALTAAAGSVLTLAEISARSLGDLLTSRAFLEWLVTVEQSRLLLVVAGLAALVAYLAHGVSTAEGPLLALVLAVITLLPPLLTGHASGEGYHTLGIVSLMVHVVAVSLWVGGLAAVVYVGGTSPDPATVLRFSAVALGCFLATGVSGVLNAWVRLTEGRGVLTELLDSRYGWLVLAKLGALGLLAGFGYWHRRRTIGQLSAGRPGAFRRFAGGEVVVLVVTVALAVALSRSAPPGADPPPPRPGDPISAAPTP